MGEASVRVTIDGTERVAEPNSTILDVCREAGIELPTLCHRTTMTPANTCRVCVVEVSGGRALVPSCSRKVEDGMEIHTDTERVTRARRLVLELLDSATLMDRTDGVDGMIGELGARSGRFGRMAEPSQRRPPRPGEHQASLVRAAASVAEPVKIEDDLYVRDYSRCILCYQCVAACGVEHQNTFAITIAGRGFDARVSTEFDVQLPDSACVYCGNCIAVCPTGALMGKTEFDLREQGAWEESRQDVTRTVCPYCGVGCNLDVWTQDGRIVKVASPADHEVTLGNLCIKGRFGMAFVASSGDD